VGWTQSFAYDGLNRLYTASRSDGGYNHTYNYDSFGNLIVQDNLNTNPTFTVNPATNQLNRWNGPVNLYTYDAAGNITSTGTSDIGGHTFNYNPLSQITSVDGNLTGSYTYNGLDERVYTQTGSISTNYIYFNSQPMSEWVSTGVWTDYIYAEGQKIAKIMTPATPAGGASTLNYYLDDHLGTTQVELSSDGHVTWQGQFTPFGAELPDGSTTMHYKFTGKERDAESGLDYFGARFYASTTGRWLSPDWSEKPEEVPYASLSDPQSLNLYNYVGNNPLSKADADGHCPVCVVFEEVADSPAGQEIEQTATSAGEKFGTFISTAAAATTTFVVANVKELANSPAGSAPIGHGKAGNISPEQAKATLALLKGDKSGPKAAQAPGVTAGGQATDKYGNKVGASGKPQVNQVDHSGKKGAKDAARQEGSGKPQQHASPQKGDPHYHPTDANGEKIPNSTHHNYPQ